MSLSEMGRYQRGVAWSGERIPLLGRCLLSDACADCSSSGLTLACSATSQAVEVALELDRLYPTDPEVLYHDGKIYGNFAFLTMQKARAGWPRFVWRHQAEAEAYDSQESYDAAIGEYRQVLSADPASAGDSLSSGSNTAGAFAANHCSRRHRRGLDGI